MRCTKVRLLMSVQGSIATRAGFPRHVRFSLASDRTGDITGCRKRAKNGSQRTSLDHLIGAGDKRRREVYAERFRGPEELITSSYFVGACTGRSSERSRL